MLDEKTKAELKAKHPEELQELSAEIAEGKTVSVVVKAPGRGEWRRFKAEAADEKRRADAAEKLFRSCCIHPDAMTVDTMLAERPGLADRFAAELVEMAGMVEDVRKNAF